jgi:hypothetical protein
VTAKSGLSTAGYQASSAQASAANATHIREGLIERLNDGT